MKLPDSLALWEGRTAVAILLLCTAACGGGDVDMAPVTGEVTMKGQPVTDIFVVFRPQPTGGEVNAPTRQAMAKVDEQGRFELSTNVKGDGAAVGKHKVSVVSVDRNRRPPGNLPPDYTVEVKPGPNDFDLELMPGN